MSSSNVGLYLSGGQVLVPESGIYITQPTVRQIVQFGEDNFYLAIHIIINLEDFIKEIKEGNSELNKRSDFQVLLDIIGSKRVMEVNNSINNLFDLICPDFQIEYKKNSIEFYQTENEQKELRGILTPFNFIGFQNLLNELFVSKEDKDNQLRPANERAKKIAEKLEAARRRKAEEHKTEKKSSIFGLYISVLSIGLSMDINVLYNYTPFQLYDSFTRFIKKLESDNYMMLMTIPFADTSKIKENKPKEEWFAADLYR